MDFVSNNSMPCWVYEELHREFQLLSEELKESLWVDSSTVPLLREILAHRMKCRLCKARFQLGMRSRQMQRADLTTEQALAEIDAEISRLKKVRALLLREVP